MARQTDAERQRACRARKRAKKAEAIRRDEEQVAIKKDLRRKSQARENTRRYRERATQRLAKDESIRLFHDPRRMLVSQSYEAEYRSDHKTHLSQNGIFFQGLYDVAVPAEPGLHYLLQTEAQNVEYLSSQQGLQPIVIEDTIFLISRPPGGPEYFLKELARRDPVSQIEIQDLKLRHSELPTRTLTVSDALERWNTKSYGFDPINMLNVEDLGNGPWPRGLTKHNTLLSEAIEASNRDYTRTRHGPAPAPYPSIGKKKEGLLAMDIKNCVQFRLMAAAGAISRWHIDNMGFWTFAHLYGDGPERDSVIKHWAIIPMHLHSPEMRKTILSDFARSGQNFVALREYKPAIISLVDGQTLIMPPGTIHAVVSLTDCYMRGGMSWSFASIARSIEVWEYLVQHPNCTNEFLPRQSRGILEYISDIAKRNPEQFGLQPKEVSNFLGSCEFIARNSLYCACSKKCDNRCGCYKTGQKCGSLCHTHLEGSCSNGRVSIE